MFAKTVRCLGLAYLLFKSNTYIFFNFLPAWEYTFPRKWSLSEYDENRYTSFCCYSSNSSVRGSM